MESTLQKAALVAAKTTPKAKTVVYWMVTAQVAGYAERS